MEYRFDLGDVVRVKNGTGINRTILEVTGSGYVLSDEEGSTRATNLIWKSYELTLVRKARPQEKKEEPKVETEFKVGDRVRTHKGEGVIIGIKDDGCTHLVQHDRALCDGHDGYGKAVTSGIGRGKSGHCWWCFSNMMEHIPAAPAPTLTRVVLVRHTPGNGKPYLFLVPNGVNIEPGDKVLCETRRGESDGWTVGRIRELSADTLDMISDMTRTAGFPLRQIVGVYREELKRF